LAAECETLPLSYLQVAKLIAIKWPKIITIKLLKVQSKICKQLLILVNDE